MDIKETVQKLLQELVLPDLGRMREGNVEILAKLDLTNKRLDDVNTHLADQSRRIDETNKKIDDVRSELTQKIDETNKKIDDVRSELTQRIDETNKKIDDVQMDLINRLDANNARIDRFFETSRATEYELRKIDDRVASLEHDVEDIRQQMAA
jgi:uncharacterized coiled-coil DUF342 family protein